LQRVLAVECGPELGHHGVFAEPLDGADIPAFAGDGVSNAGPCGCAVDQDRAGAAHAVLASEVCAGEALVLAEEIGKVRPRLGKGLDLLAIDGQGKGLHDGIFLIEILFALRAALRSHACGG